MPMSRSGRFGSYLPVASRLARGQKEAQARAKKLGRQLAPVAIEGRDIVTTFWGKAWCQHLERYSDIANRLPRGRTLVRNGSVVDVAIENGRVHALVCGSELYEITITIVPAGQDEWRALVKACGGRIDSVVELLAGRIAGAVMEVLTDPKGGLFPEPKHIRFACSCPDSARLCKHIAAVLYGIGARLDRAPHLLFVLRGVDPNDLTTAAVAAGVDVVRPPSASLRTLAPERVAELFGVDWPATEAPQPRTKPRPTRSAKKAAKNAPKKARNETPKATKKTAAKPARAHR